ncbi:MAG: hypothetical protein WAT71_03915, partial [Ignavibacteria bacterium]
MRFYGNRGLFSIAKISENTFIASGNGSAGGNLYIFKFNNKGDSLMGRNYVNDTVTFSIGYLKIVKNFDGNFALETICGWNFGRLGIIDSSGNFLKSNYYYYPENISVCQWNINSTSDSGFIATGDIGVSSSESFTLDALIYKIDKYGNTVFIQTLDNSIPDKLSLSQNYPNPFNPSTIINYQCSMYNEISLKVFDELGKEVMTLVNEKQPAGNYS